MQCPVCPKCKFRLAPGAHICRTCGYVLPKREPAKQQPSQSDAGDEPAGGKGFLKSLLGISADRPAKEPRREEPALET